MIPCAFTRIYGETGEKLGNSITSFRRRAFLRKSALPEGILLSLSSRDGMDIARSAGNISVVRETGGRTPAA
jgi:hypothetical protein